MPRWWFGLLATIASVVVAAGCNDTTISQPNGPSASRCQAALTGVPESIPSSGSRLSALVATTRECPWTATTEASWVQLSPTSGQGEGSVTMMVAENTVATRRVSAIVINDTRVSVAQDAAPCSHQLNRSSAQIDAQGGWVLVSVSALAGCVWNAVSEVSWVRVARGTGTGSGTAELVVEKNIGGRRSGTVRVANLAFTVEQAAHAPAPTPSPAPLPCAVSLDPERQEIKAEGDTRNVQVRTRAGCSWTATTTATWIKLSTTGGSGNGEVRYTVDRNTGAAREGTITIGGQTHRVDQEAAPPVKVAFRGRLSNLAGACPTITFAVDGRQVATDSSTRFTERPCGELRNGVEVKGEGEQRGTVVLATRLDVYSD